MAKVKKKVGRKGFTKKEAAWGSHRGNITNKLMKERRQRLFIKAYIRTGIITKAAKAAGINHYQHYKWLEYDEEYRNQFEEAKEASADELEEEARRRAIHGVARVKFHMGKPIMIKDPKTKKLVVYVEHEYSDRLLEMLLKAKRPKEFGQQKQEIEHNVPAIDKFIDEELAKLVSK
jgi:phage terminase small subunit